MPEGRSAAPAALVLALALGGCAAAPPPPPIPVDATQADLLPMAGEWRGGYANPANGHSGTIRISIPKDDRMAFGEVVMSGAGRPVRTVGETGPGPRLTAEQAAAEPLFIRFVRVSGGTVTGALEPYQDTECGCVVSTTFTGTLSEDVLEGTWVSNGGTFHATQYGTWRVTRDRPR